MADNNMQVYELRNEINSTYGTDIQNKEFLDVLKSLGIEAATARNKLSGEDCSKVREHYKNGGAAAARENSTADKKKPKSPKKKSTGEKKPEEHKSEDKPSGTETSEVEKKQEKQDESQKKTEGDSGSAQSGENKAASAGQGGDAQSAPRKPKYYKKEIVDADGHKRTQYYKEVFDENGNRKLVKVKLKVTSDKNRSGDRRNGTRDDHRGGDRRNGGRDDRRGGNRGDRNDRRNGGRDDRRGGYNQGDRNDGRGGDRNNDRGGFNRNRDGGNRFGGNGRRDRGGSLNKAMGSLETVEKPGSKKKKGDKKKDLERYDRKFADENQEFKNESRHKKKKGHDQEQHRPEPKKKKEDDGIKSITLPETITVQDLAERIKLTPAKLIQKLFMAGKMVTMNQELSFDEAADIALEYNYIAEMEEKVDVIAEMLKEDEEDPKLMVERPPVVCVMGHVDHGKTSLLDAIRSTNVISGEAGGITQAIGASVVKVGDKKITFLDTPGHEAFTAMRMRGAQATDIAVLVVAADDGVMPQTVEAINHAKAADVEIIVAVNKIDKPSANVERVKQELMEYGLVPVEWGGTTEFCPVSAHTKEGIPELLDTILLTAEVMELKANPNRKARGVVIEAKLDKGLGPVATVLVQKGTLRKGDFIVAGDAHGKVRDMVDDKGRKVSKAGPSKPVKIIGLDAVPMAGEIFVSPQTEKEARTMAETYKAVGREKMLADTKTRLSLDDLYDQIKAGNVKELDLVIKADVQGSVEALRQSLEKLSDDEVVLKVIHGGVGAINESDVVLASASNAIIIGFNVRPDAQAQSIADQEHVDIRLYSVIYNAIEDMQDAMKGLLDPIYEEKPLGTVEVRQIFKASGVGTIAGSYVVDGVVKRGCKVRLKRDGEQLFDGELVSLKRMKDDAKEVKAGYECGIVLDNFNDIKEGDTMEAYEMVEVPR